MIKVFFEEFAEKNHLQTVLIKENTATSYGTNKKESAEWVFYMEINKMHFPVRLFVTVEYSTILSKKDVIFDADIPFPTMEILSLVNAFLKECETFFYTYFSSLDPDRLRRVTSGKKMGPIFFQPRGNLLNFLHTFKEDEMPFTDEELFLCYEKTAELLLRNYKGNIAPSLETFLLVHGEKGEQLTSILTDNRLCKSIQITKSVFALELLFPFSLVPESQSLTSYILRDGPPAFLLESGLVCSVVLKSDIDSYL